MSKEQFYQTGFYSLITLIVGFFMGTMYEACSNKPSYKVQVVRDTIYTDVDSDIVKNTKKTAYTLPKRPNDSIVYAELQRQGIKYPKIVLAQAKLETGNFKSFVCNYHHNLFGLMKGDEYHKFPHWKESVTFYKNHVQSRYKGGDYYSFLSNIGYAEDDEYIKKLKHLV